MKSNDILKILESEVAPVALSDEMCKKYSMYDNSGIIINGELEANGALFSLDLSENAVNAAINLGFNLIVTHHPAIYGGISSLDLTKSPQARAIADCLKNGITVISMHLNFDAAPRGIDYYLMRGLGGNDAEILAPLTAGGYGRVYDIVPKNFEEFAATVGKTFSSDRAIAYGAGDKTIGRVASFCGAGCDERAINFAQIKGADAFVSSDMKHHEIAALTAMGINVIVLTHYSSENYGFRKIYEDIKTKINVPAAYFCDDGLL